jgi:hypothetical protein
MLLVKHDEDGIAIQCLPADTIQFQEVKANQLDSRICVKLGVPASVKVSLMVM